MGGRIAKPFIDQLLSRIDIVDVVGPVVVLKKSGRDSQGLCPFHNEKTPSFTVSQEKQFYHCFGCGAHGSAIGFLMNHGGLSFPDAVEELAAMAGIAVEYEAGEAGPARTDFAELYDIVAEAQRVYARLLKEHESRARAVEYLKRRGLTGEIAKRFGIGYAPGGWDTLLSVLGTSPHRLQLLAQAGLTAPRDGGGYYDRFRDRIMFPILDRRGRCVAFGGRVIDSGEPKYLNSPETPVFHKRQELYGLWLFKRNRKTVNQVLVVEGYMDVVALAQHGIENAVATLGTATTPEQLEALFRIVSEVIFCFDGDAAGRRAAWRALEVVLPLLQEGRKAGFMFLPEGQDPDSLVRSQGPGAFREDRKLMSLSELLFDELGRQADLRTLDGRAQLIALARPLIARVPAGPFRQLLTERLATIAGTSVRIRDTATRAAPRGHRDGGTPASRRGRVPSLTSRAVALLVRRPQLAEFAADLPALDVTVDPEMALLIKILELLRREPGLTAGSLTERLREEPEAPLLAEILAGRVLLAEDHWEAEFKGAIAQALRQLQKHYYLRVLGDDLAGPGELAPAKKARLKARPLPKPDLDG